MIKYVKEMKFGTFCLALLLFLLPWSNLTCEDTADKKTLLLATQSGWQAVYGGMSMSDVFKDQSSQLGTSSASNSSGKDGTGMAFFITLALLAVLGGAALSGLVLFKKIVSPVDPSLLAAAALGLLLLQSVFGFPLSKSIAKENESSKPEPGSPIQLNAKNANPFNVDRTGWFYLELVVLAVPTGLLIRSKMPNQLSSTPVAAATETSGSQPPSPPTA